MAEERLRIVLSADGASGVQGSLRSVEGALGALQSSASRVMGVLGIGGLVAGFGALVKSSTALAERIHDTADRLGVGIEAYQQLAYAAKISGVETEMFDKSLTKLSVNISKAASGTGATAAVFRALGVAVVDAKGSLLPTEEVLKRLADAFQTKLPNAADKTRVAVELLGSGHGGAGAQLVNMLNQGSAGLQRAADDAERFGIVLREDATRGLEALGDQLDILKGQWATAGAQLTASFLPELRKMTDWALEGAGAISGIVAVLRTLSLIRNPLNKSNPLTVWDQFAMLAQSAPPVAPTKAPKASGAPLEDDLKHHEDLAAAAKRAATQAQKAAEDYGKALEQLHDSASKSVFGVADLTLEEFDRARVQAARNLSETMSQIEQIEARAVEAAKGNAAKQAQAHEEGQRASLAATEKYQADMTAVTKRESDRRAEIESKRSTALQSARIEAFPDPAGRAQMSSLLEARATLDERMQLFGGDPAAQEQAVAAFNQTVRESTEAFQAAEAAAGRVKDATLDWTHVMESATGTIVADFAGGIAVAFTDFISGTKSAGEAFQDFAADMLKSIEQLVIKMAVLWAVEKAAGFFGIPATGAASGGIVTRPTFLLAGEGGQPEAIVPLSKAGEMGFGGGGMTIVTNVTVNAAGGVSSQTQGQGAGNTGKALARLAEAAMVNTIRNEMRSGGLLASPRNA